MGEIVISPGYIEVDEAAAQLHKDGVPQEVEPLVLRLIVFLARNRHRVVSKDELIDVLWEGRAVSDSSVTRAISVARRVLRSPGGPNPIRSVYGTGYSLNPTLRLRIIARGRQLGRIDGDPSAIRGRAADDVLIGRENELELFKASVDALVSGQGGIRFVTGDAGIGKTRFCEEIVDYAEQAGAIVRVGRCAESDGAPSFWPWIQILRLESDRWGDELDAIGGAGMSHMKRMLAGAERETPSTSGLLPRDRFTLFDAVAQFLIRSACRRPILIFVDDLHRADQSSFGMLRYLAPEVRRAPLLLVAAYRDVELEGRPSARRGLADALRAAGGESHALPGFSLAEVARYVRDLAPAPDLVRLLHSRTGGNPLFLSQLAGALRVRRSARPDDLTAVATSLPPILRDAVGLQLDGLGSACRSVLAAAAVVGAEFDPWLLDDVSGAKPGSARRILEEALASRILTELGSSGGLRFSHVLVRDYLYRSIDGEERARLHLGAARALEKRHTHAGPHLAAISHHFRSALIPESIIPAIEFSVQAGSYAEECLAYADAAWHFERAVDLLKSAAPHLVERRAEVLLLLSGALSRAGEKVRARSCCEEAITLGRVLGSSKVLADAALAMTPGFFSIETGLYDETLIELLEAALAANADAEAATRVGLLGRLSTALRWSPDLRRRQDLSDEAMALAASTGSTEARGEAIYARHCALWGPDNLDERTRLARELVALSERAADREAALLNRALLVTDLAEAGEIAELDRQIERFGVEAADLRQPQSMWLGPMFNAMRALMQGKFAETLEVASVYRRIGLQLESEDAENCWAGQTCMALLETEQADVLPGFDVRQLLLPVATTISSGC